MELRTKKLLYDINQAAGHIIQFTEGKTLDDYLDDLLLRRAVEREFEIIGEAATRLRRQDRATLERITPVTRRSSGSATSSRMSTTGWSPRRCGRSSSAISPSCTRRRLRS